MCESWTFDVRVERDEVRAMEKDKQVKAQLFESAQRERLHQWTGMASEQLEGKHVPIYHIPGNDEPLYCDEFFNDPPFVPLNGRHISLGDDLAVLGIGGSNPTPWDTPREYQEIEIEQFILSSVHQELSGVPLILFAHVPPWQCGLDNAPALNPDLSYKLVLGAQRKVAVGSLAIRQAVERLQPLLGLFGHVHESQGEVRIGRTLCVNPGSAYYNARLQGCIVTIRNARASVQFTEG
jgi:Icc-related predicted phosphoesterase